MDKELYNQIEKLMKDNPPYTFPRRTNDIEGVTRYYGTKSEDRIKWLYPKDEGYDEAAYEEVFMPVKGVRFAYPVNEN